MNHLNYKHYVYAIEQHEAIHGLLQYFIDYLQSDDSQLISELHQGTILIPSQALLQQLRNYLPHSDEQCIKIYNQCVLASEQFYWRLIHLVINARLGKVDYSSIFNETSQIYGKKVIAELQKLKLRTKELQAAKMQQETSQTSQHPITLLYSQAKKILTRVNITKAFVSSGSLCVAGYVLICVNMYDAAEFTNLRYLYILLVTTCCAIIFILLLPRKAFQHFDIHGKNVIGNQYRLYLNHIARRYHKKINTELSPLLDCNTKIL